jgi:hypothetical protein
MIRNVYMCIKGKRKYIQKVADICGDRMLELCEFPSGFWWVTAIVDQDSELGIKLQSFIESQGLNVITSPRSLSEYLRRPHLTSVL